MTTSKPTVTDKSDCGAVQTCIRSRGARERINFRMVQNVLLIWLDGNIADYCKTLAQLRPVVCTINTYTDGEQCIEFLQTIENDKACMVISGSLGQHIVPRVHDMIQVDSIFIFCDNKQCHEQWVKEWSKIKGIFTEITPIYEALRKTVQRCEQEAMPISFIATDIDISQKKLDQLEPAFMYTQILKEILLEIPFEQQYFQIFIQYWREAIVDNDQELNIIKRFEKHYRDETPIWWYTCTCFLYTMLNRALRLMDANMIVQMGFFISDLHRHIEKLHQEQFGGHRSHEVLTVYRGQGLSEADFKQLSKTKGGLMSFNSFLSTSKNPNVSLVFAQNTMARPEMVDILFVMTIDQAKSTTPFASITGVSYYEAGEDEVLFSMHTVFRIGDITPMSDNQRLFQVALTMTSDDDKDLRRLTDRIRQDANPTNQGWFRLGSVLLKMGHSVKAQEVFEILLEQTIEEGERGRIYHGLGRAQDDQGYYEQAITFYQKSLEIQQHSLAPNHPDLAISYNNIGLVYFNIGDYAKALSYYEKALAIQQQSPPPNHLTLATSYNNIGLVYSKKGDHAKALSYYEKALTIEQQSLPPNDPDLASSYNNIGGICYKMGDYAKALSSHDKALAMQQKSLPPNHPDLATSYNNMGSVYSKMGDYEEARSSYEKALAIQQQLLSPNHPGFATFYINIGLVYFKLGDYAKALSYYEKALTIQQQSLPPNHPDLASSYNSMGSVYSNMGDYVKALSYYEKALVIQQQALPPNHPDLALSYNNIGSMYSKLGDYAKALSSYEKALAIKQQSLPPNHSSLATSYNNIGLVCDHMGEYAKALSHYERAIAIRQQSLPPNHPDLAISYNNIGSVYNSTGDYAKALSYYEKALAIQQQSLPPNHPTLAISYNNIGMVYHKTGDYVKALSYYEKDLEISKQSLPPNHPNLATSYNNIGGVCDNMGDYAKALSYYERAVNILQQILPPSHLSLLTCRMNLVLVKRKLL